MFGIGKTAKQAMRQAYYAAGELKVAADKPEAYRRYKDLQRESVRPDDMWHVLPSLNAMYLLVPKAASTTMLSILSRTIVGKKPGRNIHRRSVSKLQGPRQVGLTKFASLLDDPGCTRFTFVRNPYARLVSCWQNRISDRPSSDGRADISYVAHHAADMGLKLDPAEPVPFDDFVKVACETAEKTPDGHWRLMSQLVPESVSFHLIGKVESFDTDLERLGKLLKIDLTGYDRLNISESGFDANQLTPWQRATIFKTYEVDFARFGYQH